MSKSLYCVGKIENQKTTMNVTLDNNKACKSKRVNIVSIKMVKEGSIFYENRKIGNPADAAALIRSFIEDADREHLIVCTLDTKNQPNLIQLISLGSLNSSIVHPREVFKIAVLSNSNSIILYHNHPSGDLSPSQEDINITLRLVEAGRILGIELIDHIIIGTGKYLSLKEKGII